MHLRFRFLGCRPGHKPKYNTPRRDIRNIIRVPWGCLENNLLFYFITLSTALFYGIVIYYRAPMSVITIVQRALPFSLLWKRRHSTTKEKETNPESPDQAFHEDELFGNQLTGSPGTTLHYDVSDALHIAVKQPLDDTTKPDASGPESDSDSDFEHETYRLSDNSQAYAREQLCRAVSWTNIVRSHCRWTKKQERQLWIAEKELRRCQKAWSSEQEVWLAYVRFPWSIRWLL